MLIAEATTLPTRLEKEPCLFGSAPVGAEKSKNGTFARFTFRYGTRIERSDPVENRTHESAQVMGYCEVNRYFTPAGYIQTTVATRTGAEAIYVSVRKYTQPKTLSAIACHGQQGRLNRVRTATFDTKPLIGYHKI